MAEDESQLKLEKQTTTLISDKDVTKLIKQCGTFGPYQHWLYTYIIIIGTFTVMPVANLAFISANVPFYCYPPNFNVSAIPANLTEDEYLQMLQPDDDQCSVYSNSFTGTNSTTPPSNLSKLQCSYGRKFLTEEFSTIVSEFDLVCERKWLRSTLQSIYFAGCLLGSIVFGVLPDRFGRRSVLFLSNACLVICGVGKIFIPSLIILMILYCFQASGYTGNMITLYSLTLEFTSSKLRTPINFGFMCFYPIGALFVTLFAYCIPDWRYLELTVCLLPAMSSFIWIFLPESPRWLIGRKRFTEAKTLFRKIMTKNKKQNQELLKVLANDEEESSFKNSFQGNIPEQKVLPKEKNYSFIDLFRTPRYALITINICFSWLVISMLYYGITLNSVDMAGNRYVNFMLLAIVEFPSHLSSYCMFRHFDHRKPICFSMMFSGLNCIASNFVIKGSFWFPLILVVLGKFGIASAYGSIYLLSAEIFPTVVRANGLGVASFFARIGGISGPFILQLSSYVKWLPLSIFGLLSVVTGLLLMLLPETKNKDLPQTFEDLDNWKT